MARGRRTVTDGEFVSLLLDSSAVRAYTEGRPEVRAWLERAGKAGVEPLISYVTVADARPVQVGFRSVVDKFEAVRLTLDDCRRARALAQDLDGANRTVDALVAVTALRLPRPVAVLTADPRNLARLLADQPRIMVVKI